jgi:hypothetical protein
MGPASGLSSGLVPIASAFTTGASDPAIVKTADVDAGEVSGLSARKCGGQFSQALGCKTAVGAMNLSSLKKPVGERQSGLRTCCRQQRVAGLEASNRLLHKNSCNKAACNRSV